MKSKAQLPPTAYLVLAVICEGETHGYELEKTIHNRGFRFWTDLQKSSIYNALKLLEERDLISSRLEQGGGPARKVFKVTSAGRRAVESRAIDYLEMPRHPRNELDLGIYALPFVDKAAAIKALEAGRKIVQDRVNFIQERLIWCEAKELEMPALAFERSLLELEVEVKWLDKVISFLKKKRATLPADGWQRYVYKEPPYIG